MPTRLNYTARRKLTNSEAAVRILPNTGKPFVFDVTMNLESLRPSADNAHVFVEAYHQSTRMRFPFGTVAAIDVPPLESRRLEEFDAWEQVLFRIKVTDLTGTPGRLIAWKNHIKPIGPAENPEEDLVRFMIADLEGLLWDLDFDDNGPIVMIDRRAGDTHTVGGDERFVAAVYPEILRRTLFRAFVEEEQNGDDEEHWSNAWLERFLKTKLGMDDPPPLENGEARLRWIENAVSGFARKTDLGRLWVIPEEEA